jgi:short-subunit dehydrogenase
MGIPYLASKHAVEGLSHSLRRELQPWGIHVVIVGPGNVKTPIWDKAGDGSPYAQGLSGDSFTNFLTAMRQGEKGGMEAKEIVEVILKILRSSNPKTRYAPMDHKLLSWTIPRMLPEKAVDKMLFKALGMKSFAPEG